MKNKKFISFTINLLIGILFSFPVFSAQYSIQNNSLYQYSYNASESETGIKRISDDNNVSEIIPNNKSVIFSKTVFNKKNSSPGNKDNTKINTLTPGFKELCALKILPKSNNLKLTFVNLSYLKDLKTTRMRC